MASEEDTVLALSIMLFFGIIALTLYILLSFAFKPYTEPTRENFVVGNDNEVDAETEMTSTESEFIQSEGFDPDGFRRVFGALKTNMQLDLCDHPPIVNPGTETLSCGPGLELNEEPTDFPATDARVGMQCCVPSTAKQDWDATAIRVHNGLSIATQLIGDQIVNKRMDKRINQAVTYVTGDSSEDAFKKFANRGIEAFNVQINRMMGKLTGDAVGNSAAKAVVKQTDMLAKATSRAMGAAFIIFDIGSMLLDMWDPMGYNQFTANENNRKIRDALEVGYSANLFTSVLGMKAPFVYPWTMAFPELIGPVYGEMYTNIESHLQETSYDYRSRLEQLGMKVTDEFGKQLAHYMATGDTGGDDPTSSYPDDPFLWTPEQQQVMLQSTMDALTFGAEEQQEIMEEFSKLVPPRLRAKFMFNALTKRLAQGGAKIPETYTVITQNGGGGGEQMVRDEDENAVKIPRDKIFSALSTPEETVAQTADRLRSHQGETNVEILNRLENDQYTGFSVIDPETKKVKYTTIPDTYVDEDGNEATAMDQNGNIIYKTQREWKQVADLVMFVEELLPSDEEYFSDVENGVIFEEIGRAVVLTELGEQYALAHVPDDEIYNEDPSFIPIWTKKYRKYDEQKTRDALKQEYVIPGSDTEENMKRNPRQKSFDIEEMTAKIPDAGNTTLNVEKTNHLTLISPLSVMYNVCEGVGDRTNGDMLVGFGVDKNDKTFQEFIRGRETINPSDFGVTFDKDEGVCNYTRQYCDRFVLKHTRDRENDNISDCEFYNGQYLAEFLFGTTVTRVVMGAAIKADRFLYETTDGWMSTCGAAGGKNRDASRAFAAVCGGPILGVRAGLQTSLNLVGAGLMPFEYMGEEFMEEVQDGVTCFTDVGANKSYDHGERVEQTLRCATQVYMVPMKLYAAGVNGFADALQSEPFAPVGDALAKQWGCETCGDVVNTALGGFLAEGTPIGNAIDALQESLEPEANISIENGNLYVDGEFMGAAAEFSIGADGIQAMAGIGGKGGVALDFDLSDNPSIDLYIDDTPVLESVGNAVKKWFSDPRCKEDIRNTGMVYGRYNLPVYTWRWNWNPAGLQGESAGVMASEVYAVAPHAVSMDESGYLLVDYSLIS
jgi:hypothetical protein